MSFAGIPPNPSVYVNNLNDKLKKTELKKNLYLLFSQYGNILDIHCDKARLRGQAWIIYDALAGATRAVRDLHNFLFFGKTMHLSYARAKSDVIAQIDGTYKPRPKQRGKGETAALPEPVRAPAPEKATAKRKEPSREAGRARERREEPEVEPNKVLFVENLPATCSTMMLAILFQGYAGYKESRLVSGKPGIAFVEFTDAYKAKQAMDSLQDFKITPTNLMRISFARQ